MSKKKVILKKKTNFFDKISLINNKDIFLNVVSVFFTLLILIGVSYSAFIWNDSSNNEQSINSGDFSLTYDNSSPTLGGIINLTSAIPTSDEDGVNSEKNPKYKFKIKNNGNVALNYNIKLVDDIDIITADNCSSNRLDSGYVRISITGDTYIKPITVSLLSDHSILSGKLEPNEEKVFSLSLWISSFAPNTVFGKHYHKKLRIETSQVLFASPNSLAYKILGENNVNVNNNSPIFTSDSTDTGLYQALGENDLPTYYYRGNVVNNNVSFGGFLWQIIRINEDGSIRLIYNSEAKISTISSYTSIAYNNSLVKSKLGAWYNTNFLYKSYESKIVNTNFCNNTTSNFNEASNRLKNENPTPTFKCPSGNAILNTYIGTITADELVFAGYLYGVNVTTIPYLSKSYSYFSMTPSLYNSVFYASTNSLNEVQIAQTNENNREILPVISLSANSLVSGGDGTKENPYTIK